MLWKAWMAGSFALALVPVDALVIPAVVSQFCGTATLDEAGSSSLDSAFSAAETSFSDSPSFISAYAGLLYAAPTNIQSTIYEGSSVDIYLTDLPSQKWYTNVPKPAQTMWENFGKDLSKIAEEVIGKLATQTTTGTSKAAAPSMTGVGIAGVAGVVGGVLAIL